MDAYDPRSSAQQSTDDRPEMPFSRRSADALSLGWRQVIIPPHTRSEMIHCPRRQAVSSARHAALPKQGQLCITGTSCELATHRVATPSTEGMSNTAASETPSDFPLRYRQSLPIVDEPGTDTNCWVGILDAQPDIVCTSPQSSLGK